MTRLKNAGLRVSKKCRSRNASNTNSSRRVSKRPTTSRIGMRTTMKKKIERISKSLRWLKNDLRNEAMKAEDEKLQKKLWRWHYRAKDSEYEVDILLGQSDVRDVLKRAIAQGLLDEELSDLNLEVTDDDEDESQPP